MAGRPEDVDALRAKLKALGYLDAGVDRFVLAPARAGRGLAAIALRASVRIGVLAGLLLGVSGGLAATRVPGLVTSTRDAWLLGAMLGASLGLATLALTFAAIWITSRLFGVVDPHRVPGERSRRLARTAGVLVGASSLAYLTLWWRATTADALATPLASAAAVLVALVISVLLGHSTTTTALAVLATGHPDAAVPRRPLSLRASVAMLVVGAAASAALLAVGAPRDASDEAPPALTVRPTGLRLLVIAIDGGDPSLFDALRRRDPELFASAPWLAPMCALTPETEDPAREWVTIATGQPAARHGVTALEVRRLAGLDGNLPAAPASRLTSTLAAGADLLRLTRPALNTGSVRREKTFWEVATQAGLRTAALNWWTSWPVLPEDGTVLSERAVLRLERGGALAAEIGPPALYEALRAEWTSAGARAARAADEVLAARGDDPPLPPPIAEALRQAAIVDAQQLVLLERFAGDRLDLVTVYLPGLDILAGRLRDLNRQPATPALLVGGGDALTRYSRWLAAGLMAAVGRHGPEVTPLIVAHPGRAGAAATARTQPGAGAAAPTGAPPACTVYDIVPTVMRALGVPASAQLPGAPVDAVLRGLAARPRASAPALASATPPVATYGRRGAGSVRPASGDTLDEEMRERLRSLGYVR